VGINGWDLPAAALYGWQQTALFSLIVLECLIAIGLPATPCHKPQGFATARRLLHKPGKSGSERTSRNVRR